MIMGAYYLVKEVGSDHGHLCCMYYLVKEVGSDQGCIQKLCQGGANLGYGKNRGMGGPPRENIVIFSALSFNLVQTDQTRYSKINFF